MEYHTNLYLISQKTQQTSKQRKEIKDQKSSLEAIIKFLLLHCHTKDAREKQTNKSLVLIPLTYIKIQPAVSAVENLSWTGLFLA